MRITVAVRVVTLVLGMSCWLSGQTTQPAAPATPAAPTTRPAAVPADQLLSQMLSLPGAGAAKPLQPISDPPAVDATSGAAAVAPGAPQLTVLREGTFLVDRIGRLTRGGDGHSWEFTFESDGRAMQDPPVIVLPNLKLMQMEQALKGTNRDLRFRITGMVTEYNGRNYILIEKAVVPPEVTNRF
ncbi:hypothetical protein [Fontivita pretiosa]|uniref:hypothetical protein n=1 Tax=Fontivita pretiosa TaxID=2989684 RepID=UPI003D16FF6A